MGSGLSDIWQVLFTFLSAAGAWYFPVLLRVWDIFLQHCSPYMSVCLAVFSFIKAREMTINKIIVSFKKTLYRYSGSDQQQYDKVI